MRPALSYALRHRCAALTLSARSRTRQSLDDTCDESKVWRLRLPGLVVTLILAFGATGCHSLSGRHNNNVGKLYYSAGHYSAAADEFRRAAIDNPADANYTHNYAMARQKLGDVAGAEQTYRRALAINPGHQPSYHALAGIMKQQNRNDEAVAMMQRWAAAEPYRAEPLIELAWLQRETGDLNGAKTTLHRAMQQHPRNPTVTAHLGQVYQDLGQTATASAMYRRSLSEDFYQPRVRSRLAMVQPGSPSFAAGSYATPANRGIMAFAPARTAVNADPAHVKTPKTAKSNNGTTNGTGGTSKQ